jgi:iron-sulfur cluster repair di-iron protein
MNILINKTIREIAIEAPAATRVFEEFRIDYCCGGRLSIADACAVAGIDSAVLMERIDEVLADDEQQTGSVNPEELKPTDLVDYIIAKHHVFTAMEIDRLRPLMAKVVIRHGKQHPELFTLEIVFTALVESLLPHMQKEENVLFPYIQELEAAVKGQSAGAGTSFLHGQKPDPDVDVRTRCRRRTPAKNARESPTAMLCPMMPAQALGRCTPGYKTSNGIFIGIYTWRTMSFFRLRQNLKPCKTTCFVYYIQPTCPTGSLPALDSVGIVSLESRNLSSSAIVKPPD